MSAVKRDIDLNADVLPAAEDSRQPSVPSSPVSPSARAGKPRSRRAAAEEAAAPRPPATERELAVAALFAGPECAITAQASAAARTQVRAHALVPLILAPTMTNSWDPAILVARVCS